MRTNNGKGGAALLERPTYGKNLVVNSERTTKRYAIVIRGTSPLLMDPMDDDVLTSLRTGPKKDIDRDRTLDEICEGKLYKDEAGEIALPASNMLAALNYGGKFLKYDAKRQMATGTTSLISSFLSIDDEFLKFVHDGWKPDQRRGRLATGVAVAIVRPKFNIWSVELTIQVEEQQQPVKIGIEQVITLFRKAGMVSGLGSFRPSCKGAFGQFTIESCVEIPLEK